MDHEGHWSLAPPFDSGTAASAGKNVRAAKPTDRP
jgi:hypothetical protein